MTDLGKRHKTIIAREREQLARAQERARIRDLAASVAELRRSLRENQAEVTRKRRDILKRLSQTVRRLPKVERTHRRKMASEVVLAVAEFRRWWDVVKAERAARRAEIVQLRTGLRDYRKGSPARVRALVENARRIAETRLEEMLGDAEQRRRVLRETLAQAERELKTERADAAQFKRTRQHLRGRASKTKATRRERRQEFTGGVEANLMTAEEHAIWHSARRQILAEAKARGIKAPDQIAELVRERVELEPEAATDSLQDYADAQVAALIRSQWRN